MSDTPFLIRNDAGAEYELSDPQAFVDHYKPQGFRIVDPPPMNYGVPDKLPKSTPADAPAPTEPPADEPPNLAVMSRSDLNAFALDRGIADAEALPSKADVIAAVEGLSA